MNLIKTIDQYLSVVWSWMNQFDVRLRIAAAILVLGAMVLTMLFAGFVIGKHETFPYRLFNKADRAMTRVFTSPQPAAKLSATQIDTSLLQLSLAVGEVNTGRDRLTNDLSQNGGGLTSFGDDVLLLAYNGKIYAAAGADSVRETMIAGPDNNRQAYLTAADDPQNANYQFHRGYLRYNDIAYFQTPDAHGLIAAYIEFNADDLCVYNTLARLDFAGDVTSIDQVQATTDDWQILFRTDPCLPLKERFLAVEGHMAGGRLAVSDDGSVYLTSGDFHWDGMRSDGAPVAQNPDAQYGKVLKIDIATGEGSIVSLGHRNPQGITILDTGEVVAVEHGPKGGDELNLIQPGLNYGWPLESFGTSYRGRQLDTAQSYGRHDMFEPPLMSWVPSIAPSELTQVSGFHEAWDGDLLVGSLTRHALYRIRMQNGRPLFDEEITIGTRVREIHQHTDGRLVIWSDNEELIFITAEERVDDQRQIETYLSDAGISGRRADRLQTVLAACAECHSFGAIDHDKAPALGRIFGDDIAATPFDHYSDALMGQSGTWTEERLIDFLKDPSGFAPGTTMPGPVLSDDDVIEDVVDYLKDIDSHF